MSDNGVPTAMSWHFPSNAMSDAQLTLFAVIVSFHSKPMSDDNVMVLKAVASSQSNPKSDSCVPFGTAMYCLSPWRYYARRSTP